MVRRRQKGHKRQVVKGFNPGDMRRQAAAVLDARGLQVQCPTVWCPDCRKLAYLTQQDALEALAILQARREIMDPGKTECRHYRCPADITRYHLTSKGVRT